MTEREKVVQNLEEVIADAIYPDRPRKFMMSLELAEDALALLKAQEPVVRCKDCMYWKSDMLTHFWKPCDVVSTDKDWYCPCGKRR